MAASAGTSTLNMDTATKSDKTPRTIPPAPAAAASTPRTPRKVQPTWCVRDVLCPGASSFDRVTCANGSGRLVDCVPANETLQRKTPTNARTAMPGTPIMWSPGPLLDRRRLTFPSEEYGGIEYGGLPVRCWTARIAL